MFELIETSNNLRSFFQKVGVVDWIALDTEFLRERTYYAKLCLIQIEAGHYRACIDPLLIDDLSPLVELLQNPKVTKVFHAAHQDLEILMQLTGSVPAPIFDTQTAASVLGYGDQMGYARLVEHVLNINLEKTQSRTDWTRRPLKKAQLDYAIDDVRYLAKIYPKILENLKSQNRLQWLENDFRKAENSKTYIINTTTCWKKVRGSQILKRPQLAVLRELAAWREETAEKANRPRKWIISDDILIDLSRLQPKTPDEISEIRGISSEKTKKYYKTWLSLITKGISIPESEWPELIRSKKPTSEQNLIIDLLMIILQIEAKENNITPAVIATRKQISKMVQSGSKQLSNDWRGLLVNERFSKILSGDEVICIDDNRVNIRNR